MPRAPDALLALACAAVASTAAAAPPEGLPADGRAALEAMRQAYAGRWYGTLTFVQRTEKVAPDGGVTVETWYESLRHTEAHGTQLRIDTGPPSEGNGVVYTASAALGFRGGKQVAARPAGNALLPLIEGVYLQPVARTAKELEPTGLQLSRPVQRAVWEGRAAWVLGARGSADLDSPQVWVDVERKVVVRALLAPVPGSPVMDIRLGGWVPLAGGWLATRLDFFQGGRRLQGETYQDWKAGVSLPAALFEPDTFGTAPHWARESR